MFCSLLPFGTFRPATLRILFVVFLAALIVASLFCWLLIYAARGM